MKTTLINEICDLMNEHLTDEQNQLLRTTLQKVFRQFKHEASESFHCRQKD